MKKYFWTIIVVGAMLLLVFIRITTERNFNRDFAIQSLPSALRIGHSKGAENLQWIPVYGDSAVLVEWALKNDWQERYSRGDNMGQVLSVPEISMINKIKIDGNSINTAKIKAIYNKSIDGSDIGYVLLFDSSEGYCSIFVAFRT